MVSQLIKKLGSYKVSNLAIALMMPETICFNVRSFMLL